MALQNWGRHLRKGFLWELDKSASPGSRRSLSSMLETATCSLRWISGFCLDKWGNNRFRKVTSPPEFQVTSFVKIVRHCKNGAARNPGSLNEEASHLQIWAMYQQTIERLIGEVFRLKFHFVSLGAWSFFGLSALFLFSNSHCFWSLAPKGKRNVC